MRLGATPTISIVVASTSAVSVLEGLLLDLEPQCRASGTELVVARSVSDDLTELELRSRFPNVVFTDSETNNDLAQLRIDGLRNASGDIVAITEDHRSLPSNWVSHLSRGRRG
jgi:hypothetical protein